MSACTTVTLDNDVLDRVKRESEARGTTLGNTVNELLRAALPASDPQQRNTIEIKPVLVGYNPELNYDDIESLLAYGEGEDHR